MSGMTKWECMGQVQPTDLFCLTCSVFFLNGKFHIERNRDFQILLTIRKIDQITSRLQGPQPQGLVDICSGPLFPKGLKRPKLVAYLA